MLCILNFILYSGKCPCKGKHSPWNSLKPPETPTQGVYCHIYGDTPPATSKRHPENTVGVHSCPRRKERISSKCRSLIFLAALAIRAYVRWPWLLHAHARSRFLLKILRCVALLCVGPGKKENESTSRVPIFFLWSSSHRLSLEKAVLNTKSSILSLMDRGWYVCISVAMSKQLLCCSWCSSVTFP